MHIILGGAYNGKRAYVEKEVSKFKQPVRYFDGQLPQQISDCCIVVSNFEAIVTPLLHKPEQIIAREIFEHIEQLTQHNVVYCICTDTSRGVVPLEKEARQLRDTCGRLYQLLFAHATTVTRIWYGIPQQLKGENNGQN